MENINSNVNVKGNRVFQEQMMWKLNMAWIHFMVVIDIGHFCCVLISSNLESCSSLSVWFSSYQMFDSISVASGLGTPNSCESQILSAQWTRFIELLFSSCEKVAQDQQQHAAPPNKFPSTLKWNVWSVFHFGARATRVMWHVKVFEFNVFVFAFLCGALLFFLSLWPNRSKHKKCRSVLFCVRECVSFTVAWLCICSSHIVINGFWPFNLINYISCAALSVRCRNELFFLLRQLCAPKKQSPAPIDSNSIFLDVSQSDARW